MVEQKRMWFCVIFLLFLNSEALVLKRGQGMDYRDIIWYHFPKTGGTSMRSLLHQFCLNNSYNMTTSYGLDDECKTLPFSCNVGQKLYFTYGHDREPFIKSSLSSPNSAKRLKITMLRDPLSWLTSRIQHEMRKNPKLVKPLSFPNAIIQFGPKYFNFFDDSTRQLCMKIFNRLVKSFSLQSTSTPSSSSTTTTSTSLIPNSPLPMDKSYSTLLTRIELLFQQEIFILQNSYYSESLNLLSQLFNTTFSHNHISADSSSSSSSVSVSSSEPRLNKAFESQEGHPMGTLSDMKQLNILLELHNHIYYISLKEFIQQRDHLI